MKKLFLYLLAVPVAVMFSACGNEVDIASQDVPEVVITNFNSRYPGATEIKWRKEKEDGKVIYEADFLINAAKVEADFDEAGNFIREEND